MKRKVAGSELADAFAVVAAIVLACVLVCRLVSRYSRKVGATLSLACDLVPRFLIHVDADLSLVYGDPAVLNLSQILDRDGSYARFARLVVR